MDRIPQIKICGITKTKEASFLNRIHAEYAGFVLWEKSRRNITIEKAAEIFSRLERNVRRVAVTVSPGVELLQEIQRAGFDILQVHGELKEEVLAQSMIPIWQACNLKSPIGLEKLTRRENIQGYVIDAGTAGGGRTFDWEGCEEAVKDARNTRLAGKQIILAGGLNPKNVSRAVRIFAPDVVDVSSGVEGKDGKDAALVWEFAARARETADQEARR